MPRESSSGQVRGWGKDTPPVGVPSADTSITSGTFAPMGWSFIGTVTTWAHTLGVKYYYPIVMNDRWSMTETFLNVSTQSSANGKAIVAVYNADEKWQPTTLVAQTGEIAVDSTGAKTTSITASGQSGRFLLMYHASETATIRVRYGSLVGVNRNNAFSASDGFHVTRRVTEAYSSTASAVGTAWTTVSTNAADFLPIFVVATAL